MSESLEDLLHLACAKGITHLTLYPVPSEDGKTTYWAARGTPSTNHKYVQVNDNDPVIALKGVLLGLPKAPKRAMVQSQLDARQARAAAKQNAITATVTEPDPPAAAAQPEETLDTWLPKT